MILGKGIRAWSEGGRKGRELCRRRVSSDGRKDGNAVAVAIQKATAPPPLLQSPPPSPGKRSAALLSVAAAAAATFVGGVVVVGGREEEKEGKLWEEMKKGVERGVERMGEGARGGYQHCLDTGVAASVLLRCLKSMLWTANEEARAGLKWRVASLLADLSGANSSRRIAIANAGGGAVLDWLLHALSSSVAPLTQSEAARALSFLLSDSTTCESVLARPNALSHLFHFIHSLQTNRRHKKTNVLHDSGEVSKGKSMLVAAIMDIVTSSCDNLDMEIFRPRLPQDADSRDIAAALQVVEEGGLQLGESHDDDDEGDDRTGVRGIGIRILGGTTVIGALRLPDFLRPEVLLLKNFNMSRSPHLYFSESSLSSIPLRYYDIAKQSSRKGGNAHISVPPSPRKSVTSSENYEYPGLWDDLHNRHVAVPLAAWALASWALASASNRSKIAELDRDGHAIMTALIAPERTVKWHGALITRLLLEDKKLPIIEFVGEWSASLLGMAVQASKAEDIPLARVALSAFSVCIERSTDAQKKIMDKGLQLMREIAKQTEKDQHVQEVLAKALEVLSTKGACLSLEESKKWSGILLCWVCGRVSQEGTRSSAAKVLAHILENHGPNAVTISQAWLTLLLTELVARSKTTSVKRTGTSSKSKEIKASSTVQGQISQTAAQASTQLATIVVRMAETQVGAALDGSETLPMADLLMLDAFSEHVKAKRKDRLPKVDAADAAFATLKGIKALTELCSEDHTYQRRIIESGGLCLLRRLMLSDDYEQLAATEAYDASRLLEMQDEISSSADKNANSKVSNPSSVRVPPTAHVRKHAARLLNILSLQSEASKVIAEDEAWCKWLEDCADGKIPGCSDLKIRSYARATLLNLSTGKSSGKSLVNGNGQWTHGDLHSNMCPRYEDMVFLINPESSYTKCQSYQNLNMTQNRISGYNDTKSEYMFLTSGSQQKVHHDIDSSPEQDLKPSSPSPSPECTNRQLQEEVNPSLDVVFVHGLCGGPFKTWRMTDNKASTTSKSGLVEKIDQESGREGTCWPREWLTADLPQTRLLTVKYKTNLSQWSGATLPLEEVSSMLLKKLVAAGIGERPVVFVTHSMGGLVVKQMLFEAGKQKLTKLVNNTFGIVFYSCPHFGSKLADMPWRMGLVLRPAPSIVELRSGSPRLEELNHFIRQLHKKGGLRVLSFSETKVTPLVEGYGGWAFRMEVVPIESAYPGFGELVVLDGTDHINSCKPVSRTDPAYIETLHFLQKLHGNV